MYITTTNEQQESPRMNPITKMRVLGLCLSVLLCIVTFSPSICQSGSFGIKDIQGSWTRQKYVETVRSTRSPFAVHPETVTIKDNKFFYTSYHESAWRKIVRIEKDKAKGAYRLMLGPWEEEDPRASELIEAPFKLGISRNGRIETMTFLTNAVVESKQEPFMSISVPLEQLIAQIILVGTYTDQKGQSYVFAKSGIASWPGISFSYQIARRRKRSILRLFFGRL